MRKIMVVDDDREIGRLIKTLFELEGCDVVSVSDYDDILPSMVQSLPDVVLMDVQVQGRQTIEVMRQIRGAENRTSAERLPVVMTSAMDCRRECLDAGADLFIMKPFLPDELVREVIEISNRKPADVDFPSSLAEHNL